MLCNKCKVNQPFQDDSWCLACSAWESIGADLVARWDVPGLRDLAGEAVISTARQLKGLRRLSSGLAAKQVADGASSGARDKHHRGALEELKKGEGKKESKEREPLPRSRSTPVSAPEVKAEKAPSSEYEHSEEEDEEEGESEEYPGAKRLAFAPGEKAGSSRPPEPAGPPPSHSRTDREQGHRREREHRHTARRGEGDHKKKKRKHRAGRKHKNLQRLVEDPFARVHRSLDSSFWSKRPREEEGFARHK